MTADVAGTVGFELLPERLAADVRASLVSSLELGTIFPAGNDALLIFRGALATPSATSRPIREANSSRDSSRKARTGQAARSPPARRTPA
jgi:hypothetical protein